MMKVILFATFCAEAAAVAIPMPEQLMYQGLEVGAFFHFNAQTLCNDQPGEHSAQRCEKGGHMPSDEFLQEWNPSALDTDQWISTAASFGARYAVLVVDHFSGFTLWPTQQHNYSIAMTAWKGGNGDVLADFVRSCQKHDILPGVFYSVHNNWHQHVSGFHTKDAGDQAAFNALVGEQMRELLGGEYGDMMGIWFDAGVHLDVNPDVLPQVRQLQPQILCHSCQGGTQDLQDTSKGYGFRWMGNENGNMPLPSWSAGDCGHSGDPLGEVYCPPESDTVLRQHYWFWMNGTESTIKSTEQLVSTYFTSVGHASNLILNIAPDATGAVEPEDVAAYAKFGTAIKCLFQDPAANVTFPVVGDSTWTPFGTHHSKCNEGAEYSMHNQSSCQKDAETAGHGFYSFSAEGKMCMHSDSCDLVGNTTWDWATFARPSPENTSVEWQLDGPVAGNTALIVSLQEDLAAGQLINAWTLEWLLPGGWSQCASGVSLGHKRLIGGMGDHIAPDTVTAFRFNISSNFGDAVRLSSAAVFRRPANCIDSIMV